MSSMHETTQAFSQQKTTFLPWFLNHVLFTCTVYIEGYIVAGSIESSLYTF